MCINVCACVAVRVQDGLLNNQPEAEVRQRISAAIRTYKPVAIFTWSPVTSFDQYQVPVEECVAQETCCCFIPCCLLPRFC
jgi:hypothetical protein